MRCLSGWRRTLWRTLQRSRGALLALCLLLAACGGGAGTKIPASEYIPSSATVPNFSHIFVIVMENRAYSDVIGNKDVPYINQLATTYGLATQYYAITHPSLPNYLSIIGGSTFGIQSDCTTCYINAPNLVDALASQRKTWKAYMESMPSPCYIGDSGDYAQKHNPFIYFDDIRKDPQRCQNIVPFTQLTTDIASNAVPDFAWITPNLCHDMHDCSPQTGDQWLATWVPRILASSAWKDNGALFLVWDEGTSNNGCCQYAAGGRVPLLVISPLGKSHYQSNTPVDHYSLLRTISDAWQLTKPDNANASSTFPLTTFFDTAHTP